MATEDFYAVQPDPEMGDDILGVPPAPQQPMMRPEPQLPSQQGKGKALAIASAIAAVVGGRNLHGLPEGVLRGQDRRDRQANIDIARTREDNYRAEAMFQREQQMYQMAQQQRQQQLMQAVGSLRAQMKDVPNKDIYDQQIEGFTNLLKSSGYRVNSNWLRSAVPFVAPSSEKRATATLEKWLRNPTNAKVWKENPEIFAKSLIPFDRDGDGVDEDVSGRELAVLANMSFGKNAAGEPEFGFGGEALALPEKANADGILQMLIARDKAEGKRATPERLVELQQEAIKKAAEAKPATATDPLLDEQRRLNIEKTKRDLATPPASADPELAAIRKETASTNLELSKQRLAEAQNPDPIARQKAEADLALAQQRLADLQNPTVKPGTDPELAATRKEAAQVNLELAKERLEAAKRGPAEKAPTAAQELSGGYAARVEQAGNILTGLERRIAAMNLVKFSAYGQAPAALQSADYQSYDQASRNFVNAILRRESGAAVSPAEFDNARRQYLPQPGDTPQTLAQKKQNRMQVFASLKQAARGAYMAPVGVDQAPAIQAPKPPSGIEVWERGPDGKARRVVR